AISVHRSGDHRDPHSFPTRRSSDLDAARRTASETAKRFGCRQRDVMLASTGVIGVVLDDRKITARLGAVAADLRPGNWDAAARADRKSTRLNSSHVKISYAVFCLKK